MSRVLLMNYAHVAWGTVSKPILLHLQVGSWWTPHSQPVLRTIHSGFHQSGSI